MQEIWKKIKDSPNYMISNFGNVKSCDRYHEHICRGKLTKCFYKGINLQPQLNKKNGYMYVCIKINNKYQRKTIHRLVAIAFIPNPFNKKEINHINGIKTDNRVENLEWVNREENIRHAYKNGLIDIEKIKEDRRKKGKLVELIKNGIVEKTYCSIKETARGENTTHQNIRWVLKKSKSHIYNGYYYRFAKNGQGKLYDKNLNPVEDTRARAFIESYNPNRIGE